MSEAAPLRIPRRVAPEVAPDLPGRQNGPRHLRLIDPDHRRREVRRRWLVRVWAAGIVAAALMGVAVHAFMAEAQVRVAQVERRTADERSRYEAVRLRMARAETPTAIVARARRLGFVPARGLRTIEIPVAAGGATATADGLSRSASSDRLGPPSSTASWETVKPNLESRP